jgi:hypothetical protein
VASAPRFKNKDEWQEETQVAERDKDFMAEIEQLAESHQFYQRPPSSSSGSDLEGFYPEDLYPNATDIELVRVYTQRSSPTVCTADGPHFEPCFGKPLDPNNDRFQGTTNMPMFVANKDNLNWAREGEQDDHQFVASLP